MDVRTVCVACFPTQKRISLIRPKKPGQSKRSLKRCGWPLLIEKPTIVVKDLLLVGTERKNTQNERKGLQGRHETE